MVATAPPELQRVVVLHTRPGGAKLWRIDPKGDDYTVFNRLATDRVKTKLIAEQWDDLLRLIGSLKLGVVQASGLIRTLQTNNAPTRLARALAELGRIVKTMHLLNYLDDESYRRRILDRCSCLLLA